MFAKAHKPRRNQINGFTLIELLVVFTLLALLLSIAVPRYLNVAEASRIKVQDQNMATLRDALDKFKADQGRYPGELDELVAKKYLRALPLDPVTGTTQWSVVRDTASETQGVMDVAPPNAEAPAADATLAVPAGKVAP